jgi:hypothetical protein
MFQVRIPTKVFSPNVTLIMIGIIQNMTIENKRSYDEDSDEHIFEFNPEDSALVLRVLQRMFSKSYGLITTKLI